MKKLNDEQQDLIIKIHDEAYQFKEIARKDPNDILNNEKAADKYIELANLYKNISEDDYEKHVNIISEAQYNYSMYEYYICLYSINNINQNYDETKLHGEKAKSHILKASQLFLDNKDLIIEKNIEIFENYMYDWNYRLIEVDIFIYESLAKEKSKNKEFIEAQDYYKLIIDLFDKSDKYLEQYKNNLDKRFLRILKGNNYAQRVNIFINKIRDYYEIIQNNPELTDNYFNDILKNYLLSLEYIELAYNENNEAIHYKDGIKLYSKNIWELLSNNKNIWENIFIDFENNIQIVKFMKKIDKKYYNKLSIEEELNKNPDKKLLINGSFWLISMLSIGALILQFLKSGLNIFVIGITLGSWVTISTIFGLLVLKSIDKIKDKSFVTLLNATLSNNYKIIKTILSSFNKSKK